MTADQIIQRARDAYTSLATYHETGEETTVMHAELPLHRQSWSVERFETWFRREPFGFRFENATVDLGPPGSWSRRVVWQGKDGVARDWWSKRGRTGDPVEIIEDVDLGLAGLSNGWLAARAILKTVVPPLREEPKRSADSDSLGLEVAKIEIDSRPIDVVRDVDETSIREWRYDLGSGLIIGHYSRTEHGDLTRKKSRAMLAERAKSNPELLKALKEFDEIHRENSREDFVAESTVVISPEPNAEIDPKVFEFQPPEE